MTISTIISIISVIILIIVAKIFYNLVSSLSELLVRYVEVNTSHFNNQKNLITKANDLVISLKRIQDNPEKMKRINNQLSSSIRKLESTIERLGK